jgi:hypothetical protein
MSRVLSFCLKKKVPKKSKFCSIAPRNKKAMHRDSGYSIMGKPVTTGSERAAGLLPGGNKTTLCFCVPRLLMLRVLSFCLKKKVPNLPAGRQGKANFC